MFERQNLCFLKKLSHERTGEDIDPGFFVNTTYIENMDLTGPKMILTLKDHDSWLTKKLQLKEMDNLAVSLADDWREGGESLSDNFVVLSVKNQPNGTVKLCCLSKPLYKLKQIADKTKVFSMRGISDILEFFSNGLSVDLLSKFAIVENYHLIAGERPTTLLKQIAGEQGADVWISRGKLHIQRFAEAFAKEATLTFDHNKLKADMPVFSFSVPPAQLALQENKVRIFTGWNAVKGRVQTATSNPLLSGVKSLPVSMNGNPNPYTLGNAVVAAKPAIDFVTLGNMSIQPGAAININWHEEDPENPLNEGMPSKVVVQSVAHWYETQKYYTRIQGAVPFESDQVLY